MAAKKVQGTAALVRKLAKANLVDMPGSVPFDRVLVASPDVFLAKAAAGAFSEAAYGNALWLLAQESQQHSVHLKFALFQQWRWPIGIKDQAFYIL